MRISDWSSDVCSSDLFYTRRNLIVFARMWERVESYRGALREGLRFWLLSYNAAHGTIMTRVVAKSGQKDLVVTSAQPGVLYVSGIPGDKNFFAGLWRKMTTNAQAFDEIPGGSGKGKVAHGTTRKRHDEENRCAEQVR